MEFIDQLGRVVSINKSPQRIVSVVPSQTELLVDLGLTSSLVGVTKFCIHPLEIRQACAIVGGTKNLNIERIKFLEPDFILANKEENEAAQIEELSKYFPVWISDIMTLEDSIEMIKAIGSITETRKMADHICNDILGAFGQWELDRVSVIKLQKNSKAVYLIWNNPIMSISHDTFIHDMITRLGFVNMFQSHKGSRYPIISEAELVHLAPDFLFLSSEPFPFKKEHFETFSKLLPDTKIVFVDGEMFSWYGSRLRLVPDYFRRLFQEINS